MNDTPANILLTGGWDSTFRLLQRLLIEKLPVRPVYVMDTERWSLLQELKAMARIRTAILNRFPEVENLLLPLVIYDKSDLKPDSEIETHHRELLKKVIFGGQYEWLARAVVQFDIKDAELCVEEDTGHVGGCYAAVHTLLVDWRGNVKRVDEREGFEHEYGMFGMFTYPISTITKVDMLQIARENNFLDILEMSWFCHRPNIFGQACGTCNPCKIAMGKGMGHRIPPLGRFCYHAKRVLNPRPLLKKWPALFEFLKKITGRRPPV